MISTLAQLTPALLVQLTPTVREVPSLVKAGFSSAFSSTWGTPWMKYSIMGGAVAAIAISSITAGTEGLDNLMGLIDLPIDFRPQITKNIQDTATYAYEKIKFWDKVSHFVGRPAIAAAQIYQFAYEDSPAAQIIKPTIPLLQRARTAIAVGTLGLMVLSWVANARISEAVDQIPIENQTPTSVGAATFTALTSSMVSIVKLYALQGAVAGIVIQSCKNAAWRTVFGKE